MTMMNRLSFLSLLRILCVVAALAAPALRASDSLYDPASAQPLTETQREFFGQRSGQFKYDRRMIRAAEIASARACAEPTLRCWHFVKDALVESGVVSTRPTSVWAKQAGKELCQKFGFRKLHIRNPMDAPVGAVIVYGGPDAGHVELRTESGFVSDFLSRTPYRRPLIGVYVKDT